MLHHFFICITIAWIVTEIPRIFYDRAVICIIVWFGGVKCDLLVDKTVGVLFDHFGIGLTYGEFGNRGHNIEIQLNDGQPFGYMSENYTFA